MSKINKELAIFIVFLTLIVIYGLWQIPIINIITYASEVKVSGLVIEFKDGTTKPEVKSILENCNMPVNFTIDYNNTDWRNDNVQMGKFIICYIHFGDGSGNYVVGKNCILERDAIRIKNKLEMNDKVLKVSFDTIKY